MVARIFNSITAGYAYNVRTFIRDQFDGALVYGAGTPTGFTIDDTAPDSRVEFSGFGLKYNGSGQPTAGIVGTLDFYDASNTHVLELIFAPGVSAVALRNAINQIDASDGATMTLFNALLDAQPFNFNGSADDQTLTATKLADFLDGAGGADNLSGLAGNDTIEGGAGADKLDGGTGIDTLSYEQSAAGVTVKLAEQDTSNADGLFDTAVLQTGGDAADDLLSGFENIVGSDFNDSLSGDGAVNKIEGGDGDDTLTGGAGADTLDGGDGFDIADYTGEAVGFTATLGKNGASATAKGGKGSNAIGDRLIGIEQINAGDGNDVLTGNDIDHKFFANGGNDKLIGGTGTSDLHGDAGDDLIVASLGAVEIYDGGSGDEKSGDTLSFAGFKTNIIVTLDSGAGFAAGIGALNISNFENLIGGSGNDTLLGTDISDIINRIDGGAGDDFITGLKGGDHLIGGAGIDTADYSTSGSAVTVDLTRQTTFNANGPVIAKGKTIADYVQDGGEASDDVLSGFENLNGSINDDTLTGDKFNNVIRGGAGGDTLDGGLGIDTVSYIGSAVGVIVDLGLQDKALLQIGVGDENGDLLSGFENLVGSDQDDTLFGDDKANRIESGAAAGIQDVLTGRGGNDILIGGIGTQLFEAGGADGTGADLLDGGDGIDRAYYVGETVGLTVTLGKGGASATVKGGKGSNAAGDRLIDIEEVIGGGGNDILTGNDLAHILNGEAGNDTLRGGTGSSNLQGGGGDDLVFASLGAVEKYDGGSGGETNGDTLSFASFKTTIVLDLTKTTNNDNGIIDGIGTLDIANIENVIGGSADDTLLGNGFGNRLDGGAGNDTFSGNTGGKDILIGGVGIDTVDYSITVSSVTVDLSAQATVSSKGVVTGGENATGGAANNDTIAGIENVTGSSVADDLTGDKGNNRLAGLGGDDRLTGGAGNDRLLGGTESDTFVYDGRGHDVVEDFSGKGGEGDLIEIIGGTINDFDELQAAAKDVGNDVVIAFGKGATLTLEGYKGTPLEKSDFLFLTPIFGSNGADDFSVARATDAFGERIDGRGGNDIIQGFGGADSLNGNTGIDTVSYTGDAGGVTVDLNLQVKFDASFNLILAKGKGAADFEQAGGHAAGDLLSGFENIIGGAKSDVLTGDKLANVIEGGNGADTLDGGLGIDTVSYTGSGAGVIVDLGLQDPQLPLIGVGDEAGDLLSGFENIIGSDQDDTLIGDDKANRIESGAAAGFDTLIGRGGNDTLLGGNGNNDALFGGAGADTMDGGDGFGDMVHYDGLAENITVTLGKNGALTIVKSNTKGAESNGDRISKVETVISGDGNDVLTGNDLDHILVGNAGSDKLIGGTGPSDLDGGAGDDLIVASVGVAEAYDGGSGGETNGDTVTFAAFKTNLKIDLATDTHAVDGIDALSISNIENLIGGSGHDSLFGNGIDATNIQGGSGNDTLLGGNAADRLDGGTGNDAVQGGDGADLLIGGVGIDTLNYSIEASAAVTIDLSQQATLQKDGTLAGGLDGKGGAADGDKFTGFENVTGGAQGDILTGDKFNNVIEGGAGADNLVGGLGLDTVSYENSLAGVTVKLNEQGVSKADGSKDTAGTLQTGGDAADDLLWGFENIVGSGFDDFLFGDDKNNQLSGGGGNDLMTVGEPGDPSKNVLDGGAGFDLARYGGAIHAINVNLAAGTVARFKTGDTLKSVEGIIGSELNDAFSAVGFKATSKNAGSTDIAGNEAGTFNIFRGLGGNDKITGNGDTRVSYLDSTDTIGGGGTASGTSDRPGFNFTNLGIIANISKVDGAEVTFSQGIGNAIDITIKAGVAQSIVDTLNANEVAGLNAIDVTSSDNKDINVGTDKLVGGINAVQGTDFDDILIGSKENPHLYEFFIGGGGDDRIVGRGGFDWALNHIGNDLSGADGITVNLDAGTVEGVNGAATIIGKDTLRAIEGVSGTNGNDTFDATGFDHESQNETIENTASVFEFNMFEGHGGDDQVTGNGNTTVSYQHASGGVAVNLSANTSAGADTGIDTIAAGTVNGVRGSSFDDTIVGNGFDNILDGWLGDDDLTGDLGADTFVYSIGTKTGAVGGGKDTITDYEAGVDTIDLSEISNVNTFAQMLARVDEVGTDVVIDFGGGNTLTIEDTTKATLVANQGDFLFV